MHPTNKIYPSLGIINLLLLICASNICIRRKICLKLHHYQKDSMSDKKTVDGSSGCPRNSFPYTHQK
jgi:hypothetical protein